MLLLPGAKITLYDSYYKAREDVGSVDICVLLKTDIKRDIDFELSVNDISAQGENSYNLKHLDDPDVQLLDGSDFNSPAVLNGTFTVGGDTEICFSFTITDDECVEDKESFEVVLSSTDPDVDIHTDSANVTIWDNDCQFNLSTCNTCFYH